MSNRKDHQIRRKHLLITKHDLYLDLLMELEAVKEVVFAPAGPISFFDARGNTSRILHPKRTFNMDWWCINKGLDVFLRAGWLTGDENVNVMNTSNVDCSVDASE